MFGAQFFSLDTSTSPPSLRVAGEFWIFWVIVVVVTVGVFGMRAIVWRVRIADDGNERRST
jgi:hypothetical protein